MWIEEDQQLYRLEEKERSTNSTRERGSAVDTNPTSDEEKNTSRLPETTPAAEGQGSAPANSMSPQPDSAAGDPASELRVTPGKAEEHHHFDDGTERTIRRVRETWAASPVNSEKKVMRMELELRRAVGEHIRRFDGLGTGDFNSLRWSVEMDARKWPD
ncbi:MAG: hypothetical protein AB9869_35115 [Verrucomicrobiia bacterium]